MSSLSECQGIVISIIRAYLCGSVISVRSSSEQGLVAIGDMSHYLNTQLLNSKAVKHDGVNLHFTCSDIA